jgi:hypothetical protein
MTITQAEFKDLLGKLSPEDLEHWMHDAVVHGSGAIQTDKAGNVSYVPFLVAYRTMQETKRGEEESS